MQISPCLHFPVLLCLCITLNGCFSLSYHVKTIGGMSRPRVYPGFMYYFKGTQDGFWEVYMKEICQNIPLGTFTPGFMLLDACLDTAFVPIDLVMLASSSNEYAWISSDGKGVMLSQKTVLEQDSRDNPVILDVDVKKGTLTITASRWPARAYDNYLPNNSEIRILGSGQTEMAGVVTSVMEIRGHARLKLYPPVFRVFGQETKWSFVLVGDGADISSRMTLVSAHVSDDFNGNVKTQGCKE